MNSEKPFFGCIKTKCLGLWVSKNELRPLLFKLDDIQENGTPTKVRGMCQFVRIVNYYMDMWRKHAHTLDTLAKLCSTNIKFRWTDVEQNAFVLINKIVCRKFLIL